MLSKIFTRFVSVVIYALTKILQIIYREQKTVIGEYFARRANIVYGLCNALYDLYIVFFYYVFCATRRGKVDANSTAVRESVTGRAAPPGNNQSYFLTARLPCTDTRQRSFVCISAINCHQRPTDHLCTVRAARPICQARLFLCATQ